jgi:pSer/pThr/pTyr-binding forkhead associated (FHA) protein
VLITAGDRMPSYAESTRDLEMARIERMFAQQADQMRPNAYLIIKGDRTVDLTASVITLGRALDNDVILEDRHVSRYHAELRQRYGKYILRDLGSSGGTAVNGFPIQEIVLRPGDLITLAGVDIIYAESEPLQRESGDEPSDGTQPIPPAGGPAKPPTPSTKG